MSLWILLCVVAPGVAPLTNNRFSFCFVLVLVAAALLGTPTHQKLENAKKLGVLSLTEHGLETLPPQIFALVDKLRTLDLSKNALTSLAGLDQFHATLKTLNCDRNQLTNVTTIGTLDKLQSLSLAHNQLGRPDAVWPTTWPASLQQLSLASNGCSNIPLSLLLLAAPATPPRLTKLVKLDLSCNHLAILPDEINQLSALEELNLDDNAIVSLSDAIGDLTRLKILSLRNNRLTVTSTLFNPASNPQPLPSVLFTDTALIDLNLHGNQMTNTQLNQFDGFAAFLDRRQKVKSKTMTNFDVCGLA
jgi:Leucine-rich repeat (LRR) protein